MNQFVENEVKMKMQENLRITVECENKDIRVWENMDITNCSNYYVGSFTYTTERRGLYDPLVGSALWNKDGKVVRLSLFGSDFLPLDNNNLIFPDGSDRLHVVVTDGGAMRCVFRWHRPYSKGFTSVPELLEKGNIIIHTQKHDYLYSFTDCIIVSQGFTKIEPTEIIDNQKIDYVKDYGCLKATYIISSNVRDANNLTNELIGKLNLEGKLIDPMVNANTGAVYSIYESNNVNQLAKNVREKLNAQVLEQKAMARKVYQKIFPRNNKND